MIFSKEEAEIILEALAIHWYECYNNGKLLNQVASKLEKLFPGISEDNYCSYMERKDVGN
jgi:hypothetical protein